MADPFGNEKIMLQRDLDECVLRCRAQGKEIVRLKDLLNKVKAGLDQACDQLTLALQDDSAEICRELSYKCGEEINN